MEDKLIDLHTHSCYSDGDLTPQELILLARKNNVGALSITDHNSVEGVKALIETDTDLDGINFIPGIELSAKRDKGIMHIVGLGIDIYNPNLTKKLNEIRSNSMNHVLSIMEQIKKDYGIIFSYQEIIDLVTANHNLGRPDLARMCIKNGYAESVSEAFDKYLNPAHEKVRGRNKSLTYQECIDLILSSNGIPVLAHPQSLGINEKEFLILLKDMIDTGLKGIEICHSDMTLEQMKYYSFLAQQYDLLASGGTDYHGPIVKPDIELGTGKKGNVKIKQLSIINELKK